MYRPEEYIFHLRKWFSDAGICNSDTCQRQNKKHSSTEELQNVNIVLTELLNVSELLRNLKFDLKLAHAGFVSDFVRDPNNGVSLLLDLLKSFQAGTNAEENNNVNAYGKKNQAHNPKKTMADEHECLLALKHATRYQESVEKVMEHPSGLYLIASCLMSGFSKSRIVALELLIKVCETGQDGNSQVLKAMSTLRLRFGEPVRFKFLVGMLSSPAPKTLTFQTYCLSFLNKLLETCKNVCERVYLQCELEEAGMDTKLLQKFSEHRDSTDHKAYTEAWRVWKKTYVDVESLVTVSKRLITDNKQLRTEVEKLKESSKKLEEDKCSLKTTEKELTDQCTQLQHKVNTLTKIIADSQQGSEEGCMKVEVVAEDSSDRTAKMSPDSGLQSTCPRKSSDAMSISSEESPKSGAGVGVGSADGSGDGNVRELDVEQENDVIVPQLQLRRPKYVWCPAPTNSSSIRLRSQDKDQMFQELDNRMPVANRLLYRKEYDDFTLNWTYPAVPLPIAVVTSGKSSLQAMPANENEKRCAHRFARNCPTSSIQGPLQTNGAAASLINQNPASFHFHKTLFQRSYPVPSAERITATFHV